MDDSEFLVRCYESALSKDCLESNDNSDVKWLSCSFSAVRGETVLCVDMGNLANMLFEKAAERTGKSKRWLYFDVLIGGLKMLIGAIPFTDVCTVFEQAYRDIRKALKDPDASWDMCYAMVVTLDGVANNLCAQVLDEKRVERVRDDCLSGLSKLLKAKKDEKVLNKIWLNFDVTTYRLQFRISG